MKGRIRVISRHMEGQESGYSDSYEENSKNVWTYAHIPMYAGLRSKVMYNNKQMFLRDDPRTSKDNTSIWGIKSLERDKEGHKYVINHVW